MANTSTLMINTNALESVSNTAVLDLLDTCHALQLIDDHEFESLGIFRNTLNDPSLRLPEKKLIDLWNLIAQRSTIPHIGLLIGQTINPSAKGLLASWVSQTETIGEALHIFSTNICLMNPSEHWDIRTQNGQCELHFSLNKNRAYPSIAIERSMSAMVSWGRVLSAHDFPLIEARFTFPAPSYRNHFTPIFGTNTVFESTENCLIFDLSFLKLPIANGNQFLKSMLEDKAKEALAELTNDHSVTTQTKAAIEKILLGKHALSIDDVCNELAMSRQTLYRKLKDEGSDYKTLSEAYKKSEALRLLQTESENITSVGLRLGYKDTSSFYKAFKRWFGLSPSAYFNQIKSPTKHSDP